MTLNPIQVIAVRHGEITLPRSEAFLDYASYREPDGPLTMAYYFWVIFSGERTIIVDTGFDEKVARRRGRKVLIPVPEALELLGINPADEVDLVLTHAHYDHIGNADWFRNANVHMARAEFDFWSSPASESKPIRSLVEEDELRTISDMHDSGQLQLVNEEQEIAPGIHLLLAPGHTPGELMVQVNTPEARILLTSDAVHFDEELERGRPFRHMCDLAKSRSSYDRIRAMRDGGEIDLIVSGHDNSVSSSYPPLPGPLNRYAVRLGGTTDRLQPAIDEKEIQ